MQMSLIIENLSFLHFGPFSFSAKQSQCIGITGASGSGKSLLLRAIADLIPHTGSVKFTGTEQKEIHPVKWRSLVALLPTETAWWHDLVKDHLKYDKVTFEALGLDNTIPEKQTSHLSSGEKQRLGLLRLLKNKPQVILLDEPTANLDPNSKINFEKFILDYQNKNKTILVWTSHDHNQLDRIATKLFRLQNNTLEHVS